MTMTSSVKPEICKILQSYQSQRIELHPQATCTKNLVKFGSTVFKLCKRTDKQIDRQTDKHIYTHISILQHSGLCSGLPGWAGTRTNLDFTAARDSEWQWHQLGHIQICTSPQTDNHNSTPPFSFFTDRMPFLPPNQQRQSTEGTTNKQTNRGNDYNTSQC